MQNILSLFTILCYVYRAATGEAFSPATAALSPPQLYHPSQRRRQSDQTAVQYYRAEHGDETTLEQ